MRTYIPLVAVLLLMPVLSSAQETPQQTEVEQLYQQGIESYQRKDYRVSLDLFRKALSLVAPRGDGPAVALHYNAACDEALLGDKEAALADLREAVAVGYQEAAATAADPDLATLRGSQAFADLIAVMRENERHSRVFVVTRWDNPDLQWGPTLRFDDIGRREVKELRERYHLLDLVASASTQLGKQLAMMDWVHNRWAHSGKEQAPTDDALSILKGAETGKRYICTDYALVLAQCLQAVGFPARIVGLQKDGMSHGSGKGHVVTEVWNDELGKWILLDGQNNATWRRGNEILNAAEVRDLVLTGNADALRLVLAPSSWNKAGSEEQERATWIQYFHHLSYNRSAAYLELRGPDLQLLTPGVDVELLFQGLAMKWAQSTSRDEVYPALNRVHADVTAGGEGRAITDVLLVTLSHASPWFHHYAVEFNGTASKLGDASFRWSLKPGHNTLVVRAVNQMGIAGAPSRVELDYFPPAERSTSSRLAIPAASPTPAP